MLGCCARFLDVWYATHLIQQRVVEDGALNPMRLIIDTAARNPLNENNFGDHPWSAFGYMGHLVPFCEVIHHSECNGFRHRPTWTISLGSPDFRGCRDMRMTNADFPVIRGRCKTCRNSLHLISREPTKMASDGIPHFILLKMALLVM